MNLNEILKTKDEKRIKQYFIDNFKDKSAADIAEVTGKSKARIYEIIRQYNLSNILEYKQPIDILAELTKSKDDEKIKAYIIDNCQGMTIQEMAAKLNRTETAVHNWLNKYDLNYLIKKSDFKAVIDTRDRELIHEYFVNNFNGMTMDEIKTATGVASKGTIPKIVAKYNLYDVIKSVRHDNLATVLNEDAKSIRQYFNENFKNKTVNEIARATNRTVSRIHQIVQEYDLYDIIKNEPNVSDPENTITDYLDELGVKYTRSNKTILDGYELDIYVPENNIAIEFNGTYWHSSLHKDKNYHLNKSKACEKLGIRLIHVYEYEWDDPIKKEKILSLIKIALGKTDTKIYARQCEIREISNDEAKPFNDANHLQGHRNANITYGLFYHSELVQLMSFSHNRKYEWEIIRGCPASNNIVIGGVSKLFNHFIKNYDPIEVFSYCDFNKFDGHGYESLGMKFIGYTGPDMFYIIGKNVVPRNPYKYKEYKEQAKAMLYGAGSKKYLWKKEC